jgi:predicted NACHT family NTPase
VAKRSLQASPIGIKQAKKAFIDKGWTQENLAEEVNLKTRQPVWRFFTGRPIERYTFMEICSVLELNWRETATNPPDELSELKEVSIDIDALVKKVRSQHREKIQHQCGTLQLLDTNRAVEIEKIYIDINVLPEIASLQWLDISKGQNLTAEEFDRFEFGKISGKQMPAMSVVKTSSKLLLLGKPGCGKTTFLQHLAIQCNRGNFAANLIPIFITLRDFVDDSKDAGAFSLLNYISCELFGNRIEEEHNSETLLGEGRMLLLLDGLDEVPHQENKAVLKEIRRFSEKYPQNLFILTCRTAAKAFYIKGFTDIEIAAFTRSQIINFAQKWFAVFTENTSRNEMDMAVEFIKKLDSPENLPFRKLVVTPLFLHLACWVFHCQEKFPSNKAEFYKQCVELVLGKWDEIRGIERDEVYQGLSLPQKFKLISQIAFSTFKRGNYFFEQRVVEQYISDFISNLPNAPTEAEELQLDSELVLKAIELQHSILTERVRGVFSFSSLTFQEYFTARKIVASRNLQLLEQALSDLVSHITEPRWREIFLLTAAMLRSADFLVHLMKQKIDALIASDIYLQEFLIWTCQIVIPQATLASRGDFYLGLTQTDPNYNIESHWDFSPEQQKVLEQYYYANQLLIDCLNSNCEVTVAVRQEIEGTLFFPHK